LRLQKKSGVVRAGVFLVFAGVFKGGFEKRGVFCVVICGENVVGCVVVVERKHA